MNTMIKEKSRVFSFLLSKPFVITVVVLSALVLLLNILVLM